MPTTNENEPILENLGKKKNEPEFARFCPFFAHFRAKAGKKTGEQNRTMAKQGETESFAEFLFGIATPCPKRVKCHMSFFFVFFRQSAEAFRWRVCYQRGLPRLVLIMTCNQLHATFFGSKWCLWCNTKALRKHLQTVQTVHFLEGKTPFCTVCTQWRGNTGTNCMNCSVSSQWISKQTNAVSSSSSSQTMLEGLCGWIMACNVFLAGNSEVSLDLLCFTAELITYIVSECDAPEW